MAASATNAPSTAALARALAAESIATEWAVAGLAVVAGVAAAADATVRTLALCTVEGGEQRALWHVQGPYQQEGARACGSGTVDTGGSGNLPNSAATDQQLDQAGCFFKPRAPRQ